jgi:hypothetical protein
MKHFRKMTLKRADAFNNFYERRMACMQIPLREENEIGF